MDRLIERELFAGEAERLGYNVSSKEAEDQIYSGKMIVAGIPRRVGGVLLIILAIVALVLLGFGIVKLIALPFGGIGAVAWFWGVLLILVALGVLVFFGRRRQKAARAKATEQALASGASIAPCPRGFL